MTTVETTSRPCACRATVTPRAHVQDFAITTQGAQAPNTVVHRLKAVPAPPGFKNGPSGRGGCLIVGGGRGTVKNRAPAGGRVRPGKYSCDIGSYQEVRLHTESSPV
ncbi:hypothetical protein C8034_v000947 [Colletotrichum sidae]|uniref:Uncharacterized protein n=1 Tax=Colletotrichum sidae TaxID=1347389 RepID=A0A4R8TH02_9PEZI|nr:hypothetical protein C8034_v000947 [Colletotrichum sidae]